MRYANGGRWGRAGPGAGLVDNYLTGALLNWPVTGWRGWSSGAGAGLLPGRGTAGNGAGRITEDLAAIRARRLLTVH